jgi:transposase
MRIVRPICCGADIHKDLIVATIAATNQDGITEYIQSSFSSQNFDLVRLKAWLIEHHCFEIAMESTGKYWIPVFNVLEGEIKVFVVHPKYTKAIKGKKTDKKDSKWIVMRSSERNRYQNSMTISNIGLASILSDPFGKSSRAVMKEVIRSSSVTEEKISKLLERNAKKKVKEVLQSLEGSHIESDQRLKMNIASQHMDQIDSHVRRLETEMAIRCIPYATLINLLVDIPGISYLSARTIIAEIGTDMSVFETSKQLSCWAGLAPSNNESANKKKSVRISKAGFYLKPLLVQCALAAINSKSNPYYRIKYNRIKKRRGHKKAIIAIARMILVNIYHILSTGEVYSPCDMEQIINPKPVKKVMTIQNAIEFLQSQGFDTSKLISSSS